jgi:hypothetical protein
MIRGPGLRFSRHVGHGPTPQSNTPMVHRGH